MAQHTIVSNSTVLAAGVAGTIFDLTGLARNYERLDLVMQETGAANAVTACTFEVGTGTRIKRVTVRESAVIDAGALGAASGEYTLTLTGADIPDSFKITLTSAAGATVACIVKGTTRG